MKCSFCDIKNDNKRLLYEDDFVIAMLSDPKLMEGHVLVISKRHVEKISELSAEERELLFDKVIEFEEKILKFVSSGCDIRQNYRPFIKQNNLKVDHLHIHLQPRDFEDRLYGECQIFEGNIFQNLSAVEINKMQRKLGRNI
ncbi:HIT family protein [Candidatus Marsarchaeota archaeon]|nr:HIT family protein [Candidatus Marsarchaeota archaeon]